MFCVTFKKGAAARSDVLIAVNLFNGTISQWQLFVQQCPGGQHLA